MKDSNFTANKMKTITIYPPIKIFDHEKYCFDYTLKDRGECDWITDLNYCELFDVENLELEVKPTRAIKCDQCKKLYQESKSFIPWVSMQSSQEPESFLIIAKPTVKDK